MPEHPYELLQRVDNLTVEKQEERTKDWCFLAFSEAQEWLKQSKEYREFDRYLAYVLGEQWPNKRPSYKAAPINNRLLRTLEETTAVLTDLRPTTEVKALNSDYDEQADLLTEAFRSWWLLNDNDLALAMAVVHSYFSTGFLRVSWNRRLMNGLGDFELIPLGISQVLPIGPVHRLQNWEGLIYESVRPLSYFTRKFPKRGWRVKASVEHSSYSKSGTQDARSGSPSLFNLLSPQMKRVLKGDEVTRVNSVVARAPYREFYIRDYSTNTSEEVVLMGDPDTTWHYYVKPGDPLYPRGRLLITGGSDFQIMHDGPNPWWHGRWPFVDVRVKQLPFHFHGISELRSKIPMQDIVNNVLAGILDMVKKAVNPALVFPNNAFSDSVKRALDPSMPNAKIGYSPISPAPPTFARPPELPSFVYQTLLYAQNEMDDDSGLLDVRSLARKKITPAGDTLSKLQEGQQVIMRLRGRNIEVAMRELGEQMIPNFFQFYTLERRMFMFGRKGVTWNDIYDWKPESMVPAGIPPMEHMRNFAFIVAPGSLLTANRQDEAMMFIALRRQGDMDRQTLYEGLDMEKLYEKVGPRLEKEQKEMLAQMMEAQALAGGAQPGAGPTPPPGAPTYNSGGIGSRNPLQVLGGGG